MVWSITAKNIGSMIEGKIARNAGCCATDCSLPPCGGGSGRGVGVVVCVISTHDHPHPQPLPTQVGPARLAHHWCETRASPGFVGRGARRVRGVVVSQSHPDQL